MLEKIKIALADDHAMLRKGLIGMLEKLDYKVVLECSNGQELIDRIREDRLPDIVLMDINMPVKDGFATTEWLKNNFPSVAVLALSMYDDEKSIIKILRSGAKGYILKESEPIELKRAIESVLKNGFHYSDLVTGSLLHTLQEEHSTSKDLVLSAREVEFLKWICTELTYKEIAVKMLVSPRTIDGYREALFEKLQVKSRVGLVLFAIRQGIATVN